jgi:hypothetical protein
MAQTLTLSSRMRGQRRIVVLVGHFARVKETREGERLHRLQLTLEFLRESRNNCFQDGVGSGEAFLALSVAVEAANPSNNVFQHSGCKQLQGWNWIPLIRAEYARLANCVQPS